MVFVRTIALFSVSSFKFQVSRKINIFAARRASHNKGLALLLNKHCGRRALAAKVLRKEKTGKVTIVLSKIEN